MALKRIRVFRPYELPEWYNNKPPKDWDTGYELVVSFTYGLDEAEISRVARLRNYDTGITMSGPQRGIRDLMFPCGIDRDLAYAAANRLVSADRFGALRIRISYPVERKGKDTWTPWYDANGKLIERVKHRRQANVVIVKHRSRKTRSN